MKTELKIEGWRREGKVKAREAEWNAGFFMQIKGRLEDGSANEAGKQV